MQEFCPHLAHPTRKAPVPSTTTTRRSQRKDDLHQAAAAAARRRASSLAAAASSSAAAAAAAARAALAPEARTRPTRPLASACRRMATFSFAAAASSSAAAAVVIAGPSNLSTACTALLIFACDKIRSRPHRRTHRRRDIISQEVRGERTG